MPRPRDWDVEQGQRRRDEQLAVVTWAPNSNMTPANDGNDDDEGEDHRFPWLTLLGLVFLTFNSSVAAYRSQGDMPAVAFVAFSYGYVVLLFVCLRMHQRRRRRPGEPTGSWRRRRCVVKASVWVLTVLLTAMLGYKVATVMPLPMAAVVWAMAAAALVGVFNAFFARSSDDDSLRFASA